MRAIDYCGTDQRGFRCTSVSATRTGNLVKAEHAAKSERCQRSASGRGRRGRRQGHRTRVDINRHIHVTAPLVEAGIEPVSYTRSALVCEA
ncbi:hypothetical protein [Nonomuraea dietziae]|uniref:hypothetical protein n=1 Tax=Nonomuraea dietziae TaxID=65515 RepID=UPI0031D71236